MEHQHKVKDPVCGMEIETRNAGAVSEVAGKTYYFCSAHCKMTFDKDPAKYTDQDDSGTTHHHAH